MPSVGKEKRCVPGGGVNMGIHGKLHGREADVPGVGVGEELPEVANH